MGYPLELPTSWIGQTNIQTHDSISLIFSAHQAFFTAVLSVNMSQTSYFSNVKSVDSTNGTTFITVGKGSMKLWDVGFVAKMVGIL